MVRALLIFTLFPFCAISQDDFKKDGMLRATATFAVGRLLSYDISNAYLKGELEYHIEEKISLRGDTYLMAGSKSGEYFSLTNYHSSMAGISYHFTEKKKFDPYLGVQTGVILSETKPEAEILIFYPYPSNRRSINPLVSLHAGFNYYASNYFHLFANLRYLNGIRNAPDSFNDMNELRLSFGLGFNIGVKKTRLRPYINP
jgi:hypothetical protein